MMDKIREELEVLAAMGKQCEIEFRDKSGSRVSIKDRILRVFEEDDKIFLQTSNGLTIERGSLLSIDGNPVDDFV